MPYNLLLVDDQVSIVRGLQGLLESRGYSVRTAVSAEEAVEIARNCVLDLVLTDLRLPGRSGLDLVETLSRSNLGGAYLLISAYVTLEDSIRAMRLGVSDIFTKPVDKEALMHRIHEIIRRRHGVTGRKLPADLYYDFPRRGVAGAFQAIQYYRTTAESWLFWPLAAGGSVSRLFCAFPANPATGSFLAGLFRANAGVGFKEAVARIRNSPEEFITADGERGWALVEWDASSNCLRFYAEGGLRVQTVFPEEPGGTPLHFPEPGQFYEFPGNPGGFWIFSRVSAGSHCGGSGAGGADSPLLSWARRGWPMFLHPGLHHLVSREWLPRSGDPYMLLHVKGDHAASCPWTEEWTHAGFDASAAFRTLAEYLTDSGVQPLLQVRAASALAESLSWLQRVPGIRTCNLQVLSRVPDKIEVQMQGAELRPPLLETPDGESVFLYPLPDREHYLESLGVTSRVEKGDVMDRIVMEI